MIDSKHFYGSMDLRQPREAVANQIKPNAHTIIFEYDNKEPDQDTIVFTHHDRLSLGAGRFLNDNVVSFFMRYHFDKNVNSEIKNRVHIFNSFFFPKIKSIRNKKSENVTYQCASRWLKDTKLFDKDFIIMPICELDHWVLVIICYPASECNTDHCRIPDKKLKEPAVLVLDSSRGHSPSVKKILSQFLEYQWFKETGSRRKFVINNAKSNGIRLLFPEVPQQRNHYDCGVFIINYFICFLKDPRGNYVDMFRKRNMRAWFLRHNIRINFERGRMQSIVKTQVASWAPIAKQRLSIVEIHEMGAEIGSDGNSMLTEDAGTSNSDDQDCIVID